MITWMQSHKIPPRTPSARKNAKFRGPNTILTCVILEAETVWILGCNTINQKREKRKILLGWELKLKRPNKIIITKQPLINKE